MGFFSKFTDKAPQGEVWLIAGLGNPSKEYEGTRHNVGFDVIDILASRAGISVTTRKFKGLTGTGRINGKKVVLLKPLTYMNLSGESIRQAIDFYKLDPKTHLIVINDDVELDVGQLRIRAKGSAGGHNGLKNIIQHLSGSQEFIRIRVGVGKKPDFIDMKDYVLGHFNKEDRAAMQDGRERAADAAEALLVEDTGNVMSRFNRKA